MVKLLRGPYFMICNSMYLVGSVLGSKYNIQVWHFKMCFTGSACIFFGKSSVSHLVGGRRRFSIIFCVADNVCLVGKVRLDVPLERKRKKPFKKKRRRKKKETVLPDSFVNDTLKLLAFSDIIWLYDIIDVCDMLFFPTK